MKKTMRIVCVFIALALAAALATITACAQPAGSSVDPSPSPSPSPDPGAPAMPLNFAINGISSRCVELRWDDNSNNEDQFIVQRADDAAFTQNLTEITVAAGSIRYRDDDGVAAGVTRHYRVLAANDEGRSGATASVPATPPAAPATPADSRIADHTVVDRVRLGTLPVSAVNAAKTGPNALHIAYGHTSHGSQLQAGMDGLVSFANGAGCRGAYASTPNLFSWNHDGSGGALHLFEGSGYDAGDMELDCGYYPSWVDETTAFLGAPDANGRGSNHPEYNVIVWSWCGQASGYDEQTMIDQYLAPMNRFETTYSGVAFVYMTCHLNVADPGTEANLLARDAQIRAYCLANTKWLFDFSDIETHDPDGISYAGRHPSDGCNYDFNNSGWTTQSGDPAQPTNGDRNWARDWQNDHPENTDWYDCGAAHSVSLNADMKACAAWWLWCRLAGWDGN
jgi:hypothetical protein